MRPGQSCPGVGSEPASGRIARPSRFNEAGAIMPRSTRPARGWSTSAWRSFNEAGAIMPRSGP